MLSARVVVSSIRRLSGVPIRQVKENKVDLLKANGVDVKRVWDEELLETFWDQRGRHCNDMKPSDIARWKSAYGDDFKAQATFLKDTNELVATVGAVGHYPISPTGKPFVFMGLLWVKEEYRSSHMLAIQNVMVQENGEKFDVWSSSCLKSSINYWTSVSGSGRIDFNYFMSYYDFGDLKIPEDDYDDIVIRNAREVPDKDIIDYDRKVFNYERSNYILGQLRDDYGRVAYNKSGEVVGFGAVSCYPSGECCITPMYGENKMVARAIFKSILEEMMPNKDKFWRLQVRSNDRCKDSYEWIRPFVEPFIHRNHLATLMFTEAPEGIDTSRVFVNCHPILCPI